MQLVGIPNLAQPAEKRGICALRIEAVALGRLE